MLLVLREEVREGGSSMRSTISSEKNLSLRLRLESRRILIVERMGMRRGREVVVSRAHGEGRGGEREGGRGGQEWSRERESSFVGSLHESKSKFNSQIARRRR